MRATYRVLAYLIAGSVLLQAAWIGWGNFMMFKDVDDGKVITEEYDGNVAQVLHSVFGLMIIPLLAIVLLVVSFFAKVDQGAKWAGFVLLAVVVQIALGFIAFGVPVVGFLHPLNAFVLLGLAVMTGRRAETPPVGRPEDRVVATG